MRDYRRLSVTERRKIAHQLRLDSCRMIAGERKPGTIILKNRIWMYLLAAAVLITGGYFVCF